MRILFVCVLSVGAISLSGCISTDNLSDPVTDTLARTPLMYKPDIQQGNVITQEKINKLEPGMTRQQVQFLLGTPMLVDTFHRNRWDYVFTIKRGGKDIEKKRVSLYFNDDQLVKIEGNFRPQPNAEPPVKDIVVTVPDYKSQKKGIMEGALQSMGLMKKSATEQMQDKADEQTKATAEGKEQAVENGEAVVADTKQAVTEAATEAANDNAATTSPTELPEAEKAE